MKTLIFIPAYEAASTIEGVVRRIPKELYLETTQILIQDDASKDNTFSIASRLAQEYNKIRVVRNPVNLGYGGTKKKAYRYCLDQGYDLVVMLHGDGQHPPEDLPNILQPLYKGTADIVLGSRILGDPLRGGMPKYKWLGNRFLTSIANLALGLQLTDYHTGYRAYSSKALASIDVESCSNGHEISFEIIHRAVKANLTIAEIEVPTYYGVGSRSISFQTSVRYGLYMTRVVSPMIAARLYDRFVMNGARIIKS